MTVTNATNIGNASCAELLGEARKSYAQAHPLSRAAHTRAARSMPGGNTRSVLHFPPFPFYVERSEGCHIWDIDGHKRVDYLCEYTAGLCGHRHPVVLSAINEALERGWVNGAQHEIDGMFAAALCDRFPSLDRVRFCNSGTEANMMALTTSRAVTERPAIMAFNGGYHGGVLLFKGGPSIQNAPFETIMADYNDTEGTRNLLTENAGRLAAVILEPMLGSAGCIPAETGFLRMLREECTRHDIMLIFDEVMTSRLAPGGLQEMTGVTPDITTLGKYFGGGFSFGAFGGRADVIDRFDPDRPDALTHAGTFNNNPFTMHAGHAVVTQVYTPGRAATLHASGEVLRKRLQSVADRHAVPLVFSGVGSMICLHISDHPVASPSCGIHTPEAEAAKSLIRLELLARGFYFAPRGMIALSLPMTKAEHDQLIDAFDDTLHLLAANLTRLATAR